ncbi:hypothetical protein [Massilia sp. H6]|uniref:hypothetical protein n=1 Tax=Massilia sp. H6 TaxID=2970464 RepID=UPI002167ED4B|nr:hypothetical protein [Massilia sp. H6]UVW27413.1 hypothetical protein NRS07_12670 [Massilia sp. H6]
MNFCFPTPQGDKCLVKLRATGRYGFSLPKTVEITAPDGVVSSYLHHSRQVGLKAELTNRTLVRIAVAQFLRGARGDAVEIDDGVAPFEGTLEQIRPFAPPAPAPRVRPARVLPRTPAAGAGAAGSASAKEAA